MRKIISLVIIICLLITPLVEVQAIESFSSVFGGSIYGKEALAFMAVMTGLGITFVTQNDAIEMFNDFRTSAPSVIADMIDVVKESWLGAYSTVTSKIISIKNSIYDYLIETFGNVNEGINSIETYDGYLDGYGYQIYRLPSTSNPYGIDICVRIFGQSGIGETRTPVGYDVRNPLQEVIFFELTAIGTNANFISYRFQRVSHSEPVTSSCQPKLNITPYESETDLPILKSITVDISSEAAVLDGNFDPDEREPVILPPPLLPGLDLKEKVNPNGTTSKYFDGTIDDYLGNVADNNTWSDVNTYLQTGTNTVTLTQTDVGLELGIVSDVPYPDTNIDVPDVLTGVGTIGGLIQAVINWLYQLANSIANIFAIPTDLTLNFDSLRLVDFKNKFPFSIPWDLYNAISAFAKHPQTPEMKIEIDTEYLKINHNIDLSYIQFPVAFARYAITVFFVMFLIFKTRDLIKW